MADSQDLVGDGNISSFVEQLEAPEEKPSTKHGGSRNGAGRPCLQVVTQRKREPSKTEAQVKTIYETGAVLHVTISVQDAEDSNINSSSVYSNTLSFEVLAGILDDLPKFKRQKLRGFVNTIVNGIATTHAHEDSNVRDRYKVQKGAQLVSNHSRSNRAISTEPRPSLS